MTVHTRLEVTAVSCLGPTTLLVTFQDGSLRRVELADELWGEAFEPLRAPGFFRHVRVNPETGTVEWPNGADLAPGFLHRHGTEVQR